MRISDWSSDVCSSDLGLPNDFVLPPVGTLGAPATSATGFNCTNNNIVPGSANAAAMAAECNQVQKAKFDYPAWTAGIDYQATDDLFLSPKTSGAAKPGGWNRSEEHTSELQSPLRICNAAFGVKH